MNTYENPWVPMTRPDMSHPEWIGGPIVYGVKK